MRRAPALLAAAYLSACAGVTNTVRVPIADNPARAAAEACLHRCDATDSPTDRDYARREAHRKCLAACPNAREFIGGCPSEPPSVAVCQPGESDPRGSTAEGAISVVIGIVVLVLFVGLAASGH